MSWCSIRATGLGVDTMYQNLAKIPARSVTVYLDTCFSGESPKGMIVRATSGLSIAPKMPMAAANLTVITASQADQFASWDEQARHGLFTKHLLKSLNGDRDGQSGGQKLVSAEEWCIYFWHLDRGEKLKISLERRRR